MRNTSMMALALMFSGMSGHGMSETLSQLSRTAREPYVSPKQKVINWFNQLSAEEQKSVLALPQRRIHNDDGTIEELQKFIVRKESDGIIRAYLKGNPDKLKQL